MARSAPQLSASPPALPRQARARETFERLVAAAQEILERGGIEALNSNAVSAEAGTTPPTFYRYFNHKHDLLAELGRRLMNAQNAIIEQRAEGAVSREAYSEQGIEAVLLETLAATRAFHGGRAITSALRAIPVLAPIRLDSHAHMADLMTGRLAPGLRGKARRGVYARARLAVELGYAAIEMLLEVPELDAGIVLRSAARGIAEGLSAP